MSDPIHTAHAKVDIDIPVYGALDLFWHWGGFSSHDDWHFLKGGDTFNDCFIFRKQNHILGESWDIDLFKKSFFIEKYWKTVWESSKEDAICLPAPIFGSKNRIFRPADIGAVESIQSWKTYGVFFWRFPHGFSIFFDKNCFFGKLRISSFRQCAHRLSKY